jgi:acyl-CoA synthetase (AMP-forming)/AMP-acid ligase II
MESFNRKISHMDLFSRLRHHAQVKPHTVAVVWNDRSVTYRKLWSRIERATARLQGEWGICSGETVAYWGHGHPDAIVLYVALARCGARLVLLQGSTLRSKMELIISCMRIRSVVHDDNSAIDSISSSVVLRSLSKLIMTRCDFKPSAVIEDPSRPSIVFIRSVENSQVFANQRSQEQLATQIPSACVPANYVTDNLFDENAFVTAVMPSLMAGGILHLH